MLQTIKITEYHHDFLAAINHLLPQLSVNSRLLSENALRKIIESESVTLLMAVNDNLPVGMLSLVLIATPTGNRARIEDLVVDSGLRGKGIGRLLTRHAINLAEKSGADTIDLTSHPSREAANALYQKTGFKIRKTRVYRYTVKD